MEVVAINEDETIRIVKYGDFYHFEIKKFHGWAMDKDTREYWLVSKWILDNSLKVADDYPTITEIRNRQSKK